MIEFSVKNEIISEYLILDIQCVLVIVFYFLLPYLGWLGCKHSEIHSTRYLVEELLSGLGCSIGQPFVKETNILAKTLCHQ